MCILHATVELHKNHIFLRKKKWSGCTRVDLRSLVGLVEMMFVFMTSKYQDGSETLLLWFLVMRK